MLCPKTPAAKSRNPLCSDEEEGLRDEVTQGLRDLKYRDSEINENPLAGKKYSLTLIKQICAD